MVVRNCGPIIMNLGRLFITILMLVLVISSSAYAGARRAKNNKKTADIDKAAPEDGERNAVAKAAEAPTRVSRVSKKLN
ncbi:unnamed protein product [Arctia plantaginis]|uniref:Uncharacterized protein n=1 Tax=Arctia plantaginis TaxID=874455 RepID=A0A8S1B6F4_ARCPL|nr:unnamed protein product [Arctia plantaginis]